MILESAATLGGVSSLRVAILCPLRLERRAALRWMGGAPEADVSIHQIGVGADRARQAVAALARQSAPGPPPDLAILFGAAGGLRPTQAAPRIARVVESDSAAGGGAALEPSRWLWSSSRELSPPAIIASVAAPVMTPAEKHRLAAALDADLVDCESRAFAQACRQRGLPWCIVRGVSDGPDDALPASAPEWITPAGDTRLSRVAFDALRGRANPLALWRLGQRARRALRAAGAHLADIIAQESSERREGLPTTESVRSILLFGGVFDPPHRAHLELALAVRDLVGCDALALIPASAAPLRSDAASASPRERFDMLAAAVRDATGSPPASADSRCFISGVELSRPGVSYTIDTVREIRRRLGDGAALRLMIGADQAAQFHRWRDADALLREAPPVVALRQPFERADRLLSAMAPFWPADELERWRERITATGMMDISSTAVRDAIAREGPTGPAAMRWLAPGVRDIIAQRGLYASAHARADPVTFPTRAS